MHLRKTYIAPTVKLAEVEMEGMLCLSGEGPDTEGMGGDGGFEPPRGRSGIEPLYLDPEDQ